MLSHWLATQMILVRCEFLIVNHFDRRHQVFKRACSSLMLSHLHFFSDVELGALSLRLRHCSKFLTSLELSSTTLFRVFHEDRLLVDVA